MNSLKKANIIIPLLLIAVTSIIFYSYKTSLDKNNIMPYKTFLSEVDKGDVSDVYLTNNEKIKITLKDGKNFYIENPRALTFKEQLLIKGINVHEASSLGLEDCISIGISIAMFSSLAYFVYKSSKSKSSSFKMSAIDANPANKTNITFDSIAGNEEAKESIKELVDFIKNPEIYTKYNAKMPRGVILYGPPGTGKTLLARALASECDVPYYAVNGSDFVQIYVGVGAGRIRDLFKKAKEKGKAVIFIDEIDAIGKKRDSRADGGSDEREQTLNALLAEMSGFKENQGIIVVAATNRIDVLDNALLRPGRFDRHIEVGLPDVNARYKILKLYGNQKPLSSEVDLKKVAEQTVYFSGAKLESLLNEAAILAAKEKANCITMKHIDTAFSTIIAGFEKKDRSFITHKDKLITAYHESGHALISKLISPDNKIRKVTIIPSTKGAGGYTLNIPPDNLYYTKNQLLNNIKISLGGRCAEELIFGKDNITTGASGDINNVTNTLLSMIKTYGMFESSGLLDYNLIYSDGIYQNADIIEQCNKIVNSLYDECLTILDSNRDKLKNLAEALIEKETLYEEEINCIVG
jgi:cell division protease FtsH